MLNTAWAHLKTSIILVGDIAVHWQNHSSIVITDGMLLSWKRYWRKSSFRSVHIPTNQQCNCWKRRIKPFNGKANKDEKRKEGQGGSNDEAKGDYWKVQVLTNSTPDLRCSLPVVTLGHWWLCKLENSGMCSHSFPRLTITAKCKAASHLLFFCVLVGTSLRSKVLLCHCTSHMSMLVVLHKSKLLSPSLRRHAREIVVHLRGDQANCNCMSPSAHLNAAIHAVHDGPHHLLFSSLIYFWPHCCRQCCCLSWRAVSI